MSSNNIFDKIDFPIKIFKESFETWVSTNKHLITEYRCIGVPNEKIVTKEFIDLIKSCDLQLIDNNILFCCPPKRESHIHKDISSIPEWNGKYCHVSLIFNLTNYAGSLEFHDLDDGINSITEVGTFYERWENTNLICSYNDTDPVLIRTDVAHRSINTSETEHRVACTFRFMNNPSYEEVYNKLNKFIMK